MSRNDHLLLALPQVIVYCKDLNNLLQTFPLRLTEASAFSAGAIFYTESVENIEMYKNAE